jgi:hypothetical protein
MLAQHSESTFGKRLGDDDASREAVGLHGDNSRTLSVSRTITWLGALRAVPYASFAAFFLPFGIYIASSSQSVGFWDTGEMHTVPYIFGISHPTGFPTFVFAGWIVGHLLPLGSVAWRMNVMSAAAMAAAAWCVYATVMEIEGRRWLGVFAALAFATGDVVWTRGSRAEVHAFVVAFAALTIWLVVRWRRTGEERALLAAALAYGLALATHGLALLMAPGLALMLSSRIRALPSRRLLHAGAHLVLPWSLYLYIPLRSNYLYAHHVDPTLSLGLPPGRPFWDNQHPATLASFLRYMAGGESSNVGRGFGAMFSPASYQSVAERFGALAMHEFGFFAIVFALIGLALLLRTDWRLAVGLVLACTPSITFGLLYPEGDPDRYLLTAYWLIALLAAIGVKRAVTAYLARDELITASLSVAIMFGIALSLFVANLHYFDGRRDNGPTQYIDHVIQHTPDNAILVASWAYGTALGYPAYVERRLGNRIVVIAWPGEYKSFYRMWLKERPLYIISQEYGEADFRTKVIFNDPTIIELFPK